jgi:uncharacterized protein with PQ loop repeat
MKQKNLGLLAMLITLVYTGTSLPVQIYTVWITQNTQSLSLFMLIMMTTTFASWTLYAVVGEKVNWHIFIPNFIGGLCALVLLILKLNL